MGQLSALGPFSSPAPVLPRLKSAPFPPLVFIAGDDEWIVSEAVKRAESAFKEAFPDGEVAPHTGERASLSAALEDVLSIPLFAPHRLVMFSGGDLFETPRAAGSEPSSA